MSHIYRLSPQRIPARTETPVIIRNQPIFDDLLRLVNLYKIAGAYFDLEIEINSCKSVIDAALRLFYYVEDNFFPLESVWEFDDVYNGYDEAIKPWLTDIPIKVLGLDWELEPINMTSVGALLTRLSQVGNQSPAAKRHKQVLMYQYPSWQWGDLLDEFRLSQVTLALDEMFLPPPLGKLPALIRYMNHETGTYFLDYTTEDWPHHIQWSESNFRWLSSDWKIARRIMDQSDELSHWLIQNPSQLECASPPLGGENMDNTFGSS